MDDGFDEGAGAPAGEGDRRRWLRWSAQAARRIVARVAAGESVAAIGRDPQMPAARVIRGWLATRPQFAAAMLEARAVAGRPLRGRGSSYCEATAEAIVRRLCEGEAMKAILAGADMPAYSTVYKWLRDEPDFAEAVALARRIQGDRLAEEGWEIAMAGTRETAYLTEVRLKHLRWYAGKLSPRKYGAMKPVEAPADDEDGEGGGLTVIVRRFTNAGDAREFPNGEDERVVRRVSAAQLRGT